MEDQTSTTPIRSATPLSKEPPRRDTHGSTAVDVQSQVQSGEPNNAGQLRRLQLELQLVRRQADAARLDAQAAAIELAILPIDAGRQSKAAAQVVFVLIEHFKR